MLSLARIPFTNALRWGGVTSQERLPWGEGEGVLLQSCYGNFQGFVVECPTMVGLDLLSLGYWQGVLIGENVSAVVVG